MNKQILIAAVMVLAIVALLITVIGQPRSVATATSAMPASAPGTNEEATEAGTSEMRRDVLIAAARAPRAPALESGTWINSEPLTLESQRGHVVIVDFWTFGCYNCRNTLPTLKSWDSKYRDQGLTIIGVHTPESGYEKDLGNIRHAVREQSIRYPVVTDLDGDTWRAYGIHAWPTIVILDKQGRIRFSHIGEGMYDEMENVIKKLLAEESKQNGNKA